MVLIFVNDWLEVKIMENSDKGYLFLSHSHLDMDEVRQLRNGLEEAGFDPICLFLKCLDDKKDEDELDDLIKREIDARKWFIYARTDNSKVSGWVFKECKYRLETRGIEIENLKDNQIKEIILNNKEICVVDLESDVSIDDIVKTLVRCLRINLIYSHFDYAFVNKLRDKLKEKDFQVIWDGDFVFGKDYDEQIIENIRNASMAGTNIVIISQNSINSDLIKAEVKEANSFNSFIIPVIIDDVKFEGILKDYLVDCKSISSKKQINDESDLDEFIDYVVDEIRTSLYDIFALKKV